MTTFVFETSFTSIEDLMYFVNLSLSEIEEYEIVSSEGSFTLLWNEEEEEF